MNRIWHFVRCQKDNRYRWVGRELATETELQYNRARCFDQSLGRWLSDEPLACNADEPVVYPYSRRENV